MVRLNNTSQVVANVHVARAAKIFLYRCDQTDNAVAITQGTINYSSLRIYSF